MQQVQAGVYCNTCVYASSPLPRIPSLLELSSCQNCDLHETLKEKSRKICIGNPTWEDSDRYSISRAYINFFAAEELTPMWKSRSTTRISPAMARVETYYPTLRRNLWNKSRGANVSLLQRETQWSQLQGLKARQWVLRVRLFAGWAALLRTLWFSSLLLRDEKLVLQWFEIDLTGPEVGAAGTRG